MRTLRTDTGRGRAAGAERGRALAWAALAVLTAGVAAGGGRDWAAAGRGGGGELRALRARAAALEARRDAAYAAHAAEVDRRLAAGADADVPLARVLTAAEVRELAAARERIAELRVGRASWADG